MAFKSYAQESHTIARLTLPLPKGRGSVNLQRSLVLELAGQFTLGGIGDDFVQIVVLE